MNFLRLVSNRNLEFVFKCKKINVLYRPVNCQIIKLYFSLCKEPVFSISNGFIVETNTGLKKCLLSTTPCHWKSKKKSKTNAKDELSDDDDETPYDQEEDWTQGKDSKVVTLSIPSLRTDLLLKASLNIARNKAETLFYESKIRVNGKKLLKKSSQVNIGDEVDIVRGPSPENPSSFLLVTRIEVISAEERNSERLAVKIRRFPKLTIEDYEDSPVLK